MPNTEQSQPISVLHREIPAHAGVSNYLSPINQFIYLNSGVLSVIGDHGRYFVPPQQGIFIAANTRHELLAKTAVTITIVSLSDEAIEPPKMAIQVLMVNKFLRSLVEEGQTLNTSVAWNSSDGRLLRLLRDRIITAEQLDIFLPFPTDKRLLSITEKLMKYPALKSDLNSWGKFVDASSRTLSRRFKKETGITYSEWRQRLNIQIAIKHLAMGDSIKSIAKLLGYESSSAFIYMFKKQMGRPPNQFLAV